MRPLAGPHSAGSLCYGVHFGLLSCAGLVLALTGPWRPHGFLFSFALYGALHSTMIVLSLRTRMSWARRLCFVMFAASLSSLSVLLGFGIQGAIAERPGMPSPYVVAVSCSGLGAVTYSLLIRHFWIDNLPPSAVLLTAALCMASTRAVLLVLDAPQSLGGLWPAAAWWLAFSSGLWFYDGRRRHDDAGYA